MDPNETFRQWRAALIAKDKPAFAEAHRALETWILRGGHEPEWSPRQRDLFYSFNSLMQDVREPHEKRRR